MSLAAYHLPLDAHPELGNNALIAGAQLALEGRVDALTTAPLHKAALWQAGHEYPGHTELLAELCGVVYLAIKSGGATSKDAYKSLAMVGAWIVIGIIWVGVNPNKGHAKQVHEGRQTVGVGAG